MTALVNYRRAQGAHYEHDRVKLQEQIGDLYSEGLSQRAIGEELGIDVSTVNRYLKLMHEEWKRRYSGNIQKRKCKELAKLDHTEAVAWKAWHRSCEPAETQEMTVGPDGVKMKATKKGQVGDPRFLEVAKQCGERRCQILGIVKPPSQHNTVNIVSDPVVNKTIIINGTTFDREAFRQLPLAERRRLFREEVGIRGG
jgi:Helix-turn-helix domain